MENNIKVCVTGGAGHLGSLLVKELLQRGYTVHATLRNLGDQSKVGLLKGLPHADTRLKLFKADIYNPDEFAPAIQGCEVVIHVATPMHHNTESSQYNNITEAGVASVRSIAESCIRSGTVKRVVYTSSMAASSPLKDDGSGYKDSVDETCWTPINIPLVANTNDFFKEYILSKMEAEKELLNYQGNNNLEVVTLPCGVMGGETLLSSVPNSVAMLLSQVKGDHMGYNILRSVEEQGGKIPIVHIEDVVAAHIFCMDKSVPSGRYLCANGFLESAEIAGHYLEYHPDLKIPQEFIQDTMSLTSWGSTKLQDSGFQFKYDAKMTLDEGVRCARRFGYLI